jgi:hypothetical protein
MFVGDDLVQICRFENSAADWPTLRSVPELIQLRILHYRRCHCGQNRQSCIVWSAFEDPTLPTPTLWRLAREGSMAEGMKVSNPSVTWPNHTSMVTGAQPEKHGVLFNGLLVRGGMRLPRKLPSFPLHDHHRLVQCRRRGGQGEHPLVGVDTDIVFQVWYFSFRLRSD